MSMQSYYLGSGFEPGKPLQGGCVAQVVASKAPGFAEGEVVSGMLPWSSHQIVEADAQGLIVGQLLKHVYGCKVIGSAGSNDKVALLHELGFDAAFNYHTTPKEQALKEAAPDGIDIYWENVGGPVLETVIEMCRPHARIVACGMISQYDLPDEEKYGVKNLFHVVTKRIKMQGMVVGDYYAELGKEFATTMGKYVTEGKVKAVEHVTEGIENAGKAWVEMMAGGNTGKAVVKVAAEDPFPVKKE
uniref:Alcohol dehydrogenase-like C-terminal domain-containing protein n=1 Tax=Tetradesmus obliquus TaxID=3088 RepID=A0A383WMI6_TETOB|eukprot:jgi/Sobl393_1/6359/SZX78432.1